MTAAGVARIRAHGQATTSTASVGIVAGFTTDVCVYATATNAYDLGYHVYALRDAMAGYFPEQSELMLKNTYPMWSKVLGNDEWLAMFGLAQRTER